MAVPARAQWTVINLHPAGAANSQAWDIDAGQQAGEASFGATTPQARRAALWTGSAASFANLHPSFATFSYILGTKGGQHVGAALVDGFSQASLWTGATPASWVSLHPAGADFSVGMGGGAGGQVGRCRFGVGTPIVGMLWNGSAASFVNLHPFGFAEETWAKGIDGGQQVGSAAVGGTGRSSLWNGNAASWVDLTPPTELASNVERTHGGTQVGMVVVGGQTGFPAAALWSGTPESWVNLHPAGASDSWAYGVHAGHQVGHATIGGQRRAAYWSGSAASFVNLHDLLPAGVYASSEARGVWVDQNGGIFVVGWARIASLAHNQAILWVLPSDPPPCYPNCDQSTTPPVLNVGDFTCFLQRFAAGDAYANCDNSTTPPVLNVGDFTCFLQRFAAGCP
jgi:hypothetical protein